MIVFLFIYSKNGKYTVLESEESKREHDNLISDGWFHESTVDACVYLANLLNKPKHVRNLQ